MSLYKAICLQYGVNPLEYSPEELADKTRKGMKVNFALVRTIRVILLMSGITWYMSASGGSDVTLEYAKYATFVSLLAYTVSGLALEKKKNLMDSLLKSKLIGLIKK
ncbi:hypothetical protein VCHA53O466_50095 [Vibrio chagasii]|nr:hypothetical protein VCHA53O466_50095 [Vibrio chagasii]